MPNPFLPSRPDWMHAALRALPAALGVAIGFAVVVKQVNEVDVAGNIEFARPQFAHANDEQLGRFTLWREGGAMA